jgi:exopolysaccharide biosynthesis polyprenyl glycosylphosphotransferase
MIRRHESGFSFALLVADAGLAIVVVVAVFAATFGPDWQSDLALVLPQWTLSVALYALSWVGLLAAQGLYRPRARWSAYSDAIAVARSAVVLAAGVVAVLFVVGYHDVTRFVLLVIFPIQAWATISARVGLRAIFNEARRRGRNLRSLLIVGTGPGAREFDRKITERWDIGLTVVGCVGPEPVETMRPGLYLGPLDRLSELFHEQVIDEVAICLPAGETDLISEIYRRCADEGKTVRIPIELPDQVMSAGRIEDLDGTPVLSLISGPDHVIPLAAKRLVDIVGAAVGLVVLSPIFAVAALIIVATDGRPVLFTQPRAGVNGRPFRIVKFRTMTRDADAQRGALREHNEVAGGASFKMTNDPRITPIGRFLRKTSIDELPQLWNVLKGEMSLVGPRPHPFDDVAGYDAWHRRRLSMKPGITGLWQIAGRGEPSFDRWVQLDLDYIDHWSIWLDFRLLIKTIPAMLRAEGR